MYRKGYMDIYDDGESEDTLIKLSSSSVVVAHNPWGALSQLSNPNQLSPFILNGYGRYNKIR